MSLDGYEVVAASSEFNNTDTIWCVVNAPTGKVVIGGGGGIPDSRGILVTSIPNYYQPTGKAIGWVANGRNTDPSGGPITIQAWAICVNE